MKVTKFVYANCRSSLRGLDFYITLSDIFYCNSDNYLITLNFNLNLLINRDSGITQWQSLVAGTVREPAWVCIPVATGSRHEYELLTLILAPNKHKHRYEVEC